MVCAVIVKVCLPKPCSSVSQMQEEHVDFPKSKLKSPEKLLADINFSKKSLNCP